MLVWSSAFRRLERLGPAEAGTPCYPRLHGPKAWHQSREGSPRNSSVIDAEAVAPKHNQQLFPGFGGDGFLRLGEPSGYLFLFRFAFCFPITRSLAVPASFHFAFDRITTDLAMVFGGDLVSLGLTDDL